jgi:hypothetical protein
VVLLSAALPVAPTAAATTYPASRTPNQATGAIFSPYTDAFGTTEDNVVKADLALQHYAVTRFTGNATVEAAKANPATKTATTALDFRTFLAGGFGVLHAVTHGLLGEIAVERHNTSAECSTALADYTKPGGAFASPAGQLACDNPGPPASGGCPVERAPATSKCTIMFTRAGIIANYTDQNTIVFLNACYSDSLYESFRSVPKEFLGNTSCVANGNAVDNATRFWNRMAGKPGSQNLRWATVACGGGTTYPTKCPGYYDPLVFRHRLDNPSTDTDLAPAVKQTLPALHAHVKNPGASSGVVVFDTKMETSVDPTTVVSVSGCGASVNNAKWDTFADGTNALSFSLQVTNKSGGGVVTLTVNANNAKAASPNGSLLDGNQAPTKNFNGEGPNGDNYVWSAYC